MAVGDKLPAMPVDGAKIKAARQAARLTRREVAEVLGVSVAAVERWELRSGQPRAGNLSRLAAVLGVTVDSLFRDPQLELGP